MPGRGAPHGPNRQLQLRHPGNITGFGTTLSSDFGKVLQACFLGFTVGGRARALRTLAAGARAQQVPRGDCDRCCLGYC